MAWQAVFIALFASSGQLIIIENLQKFAVLRNIVGCVVSIVLNLVLIPKYGIIGSAIATIATMAFSGYLSHILIRPFQHLFKLQTKAIFGGWRIILYLTKFRN
jgi:O-antigen/teichoic acid export membrane protein